MEKEQADFKAYKENLFSKPKVGFLTFSQQAEHYMEGGKGEGKEAYPVDRTDMLHKEAVKSLKAVWGI